MWGRLGTTLIIYCILIMSICLHITYSLHQPQRSECSTAPFWFQYYTLVGIVYQKAIPTVRSPMHCGSDSVLKKGTYWMYNIYLLGFTSYHICAEKAAIQLFRGCQTDSFGLNIKPHFGWNCLYGTKKQYLTYSDALWVLETAF